MLAGVMQEVRRELIGHSLGNSRDVNDRYTNIQLPEKRDAIRKLEVWYDAEIAELAQTTDAPAETQEPQPQHQQGGLMPAPFQTESIVAIRTLFFERLAQINSILSKLTRRFHGRYPKPQSNSVLACSPKPMTGSGNANHLDCPRECLEG